jgi:hypothetical protein
MPTLNIVDKLRIVPSETYSVFSDLAFKGDRDYLHGTDTHDWIAGLAAKAGLQGEATSIQLSFHRMFRHQLVLLGANETSHESEEPAVQVQLQGVAGEVKWDFYESERVPSRRVPYDEDLVGANCRVEGKRIKYLGGANFRPIEILVAMTKVLHFEVFADRTVKWLFVRLELPRFLSEKDLKGLSVEMKQAIPKRFSKNEVRSDSGLSGAIYFSAR